MNAQTCPICGTEVAPSTRYPCYVCAQCFERASDRDGRRLEFSNLSLSGGYEACYVDSGARYDSHDCWIDGVRCHADEARFGGIVIEPSGASRGQGVDVPKSS